MRAVVVTLLRQPDPAWDRHGVYQRLGMFLHGLRKICDEIEIVHFSHPQEIMSASRLSAVSSSFWGIPVNVTQIPVTEQARSWWQTASLPFSLDHRGDFRPYVGSAQARALSEILDGAPNIVFAQQLPAMAALQQLPRITAPIFFDLDDLQHMVKWRAAQIATSRYASMRAYLEVPALLRAERLCVARAARTFVCSDFDRTVLSGQHFDVSRTVVVPNSVEIPLTRPHLSSHQSILLLGNYGYPPNAEAAERLIRQIWPRIRSRLGGATLIVAGQHPDRIPSFHDRTPRVEFTGFVDDLAALYARARIVCCPIANGGGTRIKIIEAAGYGKPVAATHVAVEGLDFTHGRDALIYDDDDELALACIRLLQDDILADELAAAAYHKAGSSHSRADLPEQIAEELRAGLASFVPEPEDFSDGSETRFRNALNRFSGSLNAPVAKRENR